MIEISEDLKQPHFALTPGQRAVAERFAFAMAKFKKVNHRPFPSWSDALWVLIQLGVLDGDRLTADDAGTNRAAEGPGEEP